MSKVMIRHYRIKRARGFWEPTPAMKRLGFRAVPCGTDGPDAWATAEEWNRRWDRTRQGEEPSPAMAAADNLSPLRLEELTVYPSRSMERHSAAIGARRSGTKRHLVHVKTGGDAGDT